LDQARSRFRCVELAQLHEAELSNNVPDPALFQKSIPIPLGKCDAFISHSWHDDPEKKWQALQSWRAEFIAENGREPTVWLDKTCINQSDIEADLRCLPIFLSGCNELVVLCGRTYLSRLWCIVELFTFVHMGLDVDRIKFRPLCSDGDNAGEGDGSDVLQSLSDFDASRCECYDGGDKETMHNAIYAVFGDMQNFNKAMLDVLWAADLSTKARSARIFSEPEGGHVATGGA